MCGRMNISDMEGIKVLLESVGMTTWPTRDPRFNVAPTQSLDVVALNDDGSAALQTMSWGISMKTKGKKKQSITRRIPNSRDDKVWTSYLWRYLIPKNRALVPVNGFYEWQRHNKKLVSAYHITPASSDAMFFAAIYRNPKEEDKHEYPEVSIITTAANEEMSPVHDRMPVILSSQNAAMTWLQEDDPNELNTLMQPASGGVLKLQAVSDYVNKSSNEGAMCIKPN